jgi:hypothetical protein
MSALQTTRIEPPHLVSLPQVADDRGNLTFIEGGVHVAFGIERVYYLYDVPGGAERDGQAHTTLHQLLIALSGSVDVDIDDGRHRKSFHLNRAYSGLCIPPMCSWRTVGLAHAGAFIAPPLSPQR